LRKVKSEAKASMRTPIVAASLAVPAGSLTAVETAVEDIKAAGRVTGVLELATAAEGQGDQAVQGGMVVTSSELGEAPPRNKG
jgi:valyl-tRNA synthetase